jgi:superoxide reductase
MEIIRTADWKKEKHVPVIELLDKKEGEVTVEVTIGKEIPHPNTLEHHIRWIELYYIPEKGQFLYPVGRTEFGGHGEVKLFTEAKAIFKFKAAKPGKLMALSLCNIHGLWKHETKLP